jgi:hypothetical protein
VSASIRTWRVITVTAFELRRTTRLP